MTGNVINIPGYKLKDGKVVKEPTRHPVQRQREQRSRKKTAVSRGKAKQFNHIGKA